MKRVSLVLTAVVCAAPSAAPQAQAGDPSAVTPWTELEHGGIHFESDNEVGLAVGRRVGRVATRACHVG
jgi:hypothetical protein